MRVVYDVSVLGLGLYDQRARTGVSRYVENLWLALADNGDIELSCCAFHSLEQYLQLFLNSESFTGLSGGALIPPKRPIAKALLRAIGKFYPGTSLARSQPFRLQFLSGLLSVANRSCRDCALVDMADREIFHSTFYPLPKSRQTKDRYMRFLTIHDLIPLLYPSLFGEEEKTLFSRLITSIEPEDWVIVNSEATKNDLCNNVQIDPSKVFVTHLAASGHFRPCSDAKTMLQVRARYDIPDAPYVLSVCTLEPRKNLDAVVRSFAQLLKEQSASDLNLVLVGTAGWDFDKVLNEIDMASSLRGRIIVTGYVLDEDLKALYSGAMMFIYPSLYEGFGLPPLEAMQCGVPVITSNTSAIPEVVGDAGILVDPTDDEGLCQAMLEILTNSSLRESLSVKSLERSKLFSWKKCAQLTIEAYKTALSC